MNKLIAYAQLMRLPNVFTALADIALGAMIASPLAWGGPFDWTLVGFALLAGGASASLYLSGMVLNDYFDADVDRQERPHRPIPSGRVPKKTAGALGISLLILGIVLASVLSYLILFVTGAWDSLQTGATICRPCSITIVLAFCIVLYDGGLKRTPMGPLGMGACRFFNVLLGTSVTGLWPEPWMVQIAAVVGVYIVGVTWFARTEATTSKRWSLILATGVILGAIIAAVVLPAMQAPTNEWHVTMYPYLLSAWAVVIGLPLVQAIRQPEPKHVQAAIKRCILGLIGLDAVLAFGVVGWPGLLILLLLPPAVLLGRWIYST